MKEAERRAQSRFSYFLGSHDGDPLTLLLNQRVGEDGRDSRRVEQPPRSGIAIPGPLSCEQLLERAEVVRDVRIDLIQRTEAFQEIIDSELGETHLLRARVLERELGLRQIYIKFEGGNPSGTQKDRVAYAHVMDALRRGFDSVVVATCGNYGAAISRAAWYAGLRCVVFIPATYHLRRIEMMKEFGAEILRGPEGSDYEATVAFSSEYAKHHGLYDANPGGANTAIQLEAYGQIAYEVFNDLGDAPTVIACPVSNGTTLAGVYRGFVSLFRRGKTSHVPKVAAGSSHGKNPIVRSFSLAREACEDLSPAKIRETAVNEPLVNWHSIDGDLALRAIQESRGWTCDISDHALRSWASRLRKQVGINALPAATAGLIAIAMEHERQKLGNGRYVAVVTARGS